MEVPKIHASKTPPRIHYIVEWAEKRNLKQADLVRLMDADKSVVSRWFSGSTPSDKYLAPLAELFGTDISGLFRHPDDDWLTRLFREKSLEERTRIMRILLEELHTSPAKPPDRTGTNDD